MSRKCSASVAVLYVACLIGEQAGCGNTSSTATGDVQAARGVLKVLGIEYGRFVSEHDGRAPKDKQEFVSYLEFRKNHIVGLKQVEQLFTSPRDGAPLVVFYGESMPPVDESGFPVIARESVGEAGSVLVANTRGGVREVAPEQLPPHLAASN